MAAVAHVMASGFDWGAPFWGGLNSTYRSLVSAACMYPFLILAVRLFGKRSVSKMNNFDWIVTVAIGSMIASCIGFRAVTIVDCALSILTLLSMQWALTKLMARSDTFSDAIKAKPSLLVLRGEYRHDTMRCERVTTSEVQAALRANGLTDLSQAFAVVLETNADFTVVPRSDASNPSAKSSALHDLDV